VNKWLLVAFFLACAIVGSGLAFAARVSDVRATLHNFSNAPAGSATPTGTVPARTVMSTSNATGGTDQVCVFCHTPHGASAGITPLWNRKVNATANAYTAYTSSSLDAEAIQGALSKNANGSSKLCLSCHDGSLAISSVNVLNGAGSPTTPGTVTINMTGTGAGGTMPPGSYGETTGFTRKLGVDLTNDHPISVTFNSTLADRDGELRALDSVQKYPAGTGTVIGVRSSGYKPKLPLEPTGPLGAGQIQCATCHDPHIRESNAGAVDYGNEKFLRLNRFQAAAATGIYNQANDIICLSCHTKSGIGGTSNTSWAYSVHANNQVTTQTYTTAGANLRQFPASLPVWQAACLNCHDTHTVSGARRLLREGTNPGVASPKPGGAGTSAIEETCYQCHDGTVTVLNSVATVPNIKTDFSLLRHMPIANATETHDIGGNFTIGSDGYNECASTTNGCGKDFIESRAKLGVSALTNRHAECTDCHNPHRVVKFQDFRGPSAAYGTISGAPDASGTHPHQSTTNHSNIASGVLRGAWGVEPVYGAATNPASFHTLPSSYTVKRGDPATSATANVFDTYVTREYQICLKCHSDFGYSDNNVYPSGNRPALGSFTGGTTSGTNGLTMYTNQAKEFQAPVGHRGEGINKGNEAGSADSITAGARFDANNHRSWHPVMDITNRTLVARNITGITPWRTPWSNQVGSNTMYCSDCHGSNVTSTTSVRPDGNGTDAAPTENGNPWGPHGSTNDFILKGSWTDTKGSNVNLLCFKCHDNAVYSSRNDSGRRTGFYDGFTGKGNLHNYHVDRVGELRCTWCHVAVPHGWKNRSLLVNLNDVGEEAGQGAGSSKEVAINSSAGVYTQEPYYYKAKLKIVSFAASGSWRDTNCGSVGKSGTGPTTGIINSSGGSGNTNLTGKDWMTTTCDPPP
jgi:hypothetical protein